MERTVFVNTVHSNGWFLQIFKRVDCLELAFDYKAHIADHAISVSRAIVFEFLPFDVESEGGEATNIDLFLDFLLLGEINGCDHEFGILSFEFGGELLVFWGELDAMPASGGVILNEDVFVVLEGFLVGLVG